MLQKLRQDGWTVRLKEKRPSRRRAPRDNLTNALRAAVSAYRRVGEPGAACRAALRAYKRIRPNDERTSERVAKALVVVMQQWPDTLAMQK